MLRGQEAAPAAGFAIGAGLSGLARMLLLSLLGEWLVRTVKF
jgi:hypothetical protein